MFCINCFHTNTAVTNSRPLKKQPAVWRRRQCSHCGTLFTTYERPSLADNKPVLLPTGKTESFNLGKLIVSISKAFSHEPSQIDKNALWLAYTAEDALSTNKQTLTPQVIANTTYGILKHFDELAAVQYAARHQLISSVRRRGRPSLHEHEQPKDGSPSR